MFNYIFSLFKYLIFASFIAIISSKYSVSSSENKIMDIIETVVTNTMDKSSAKLEKSFEEKIFTTNNSYSLMNFNKNDENFLQLNVVQKSLTNILLSDLLFRNNRYRQSSLVYALLSIIHESTKKESLVSLEELSSYLSPNSEHRTFEEIILLICDEKNLDIKIYKRLIYTLSVFLKQHNIKNDIKNNVYINSIYQSWLKANLSLITSLDIVTLIQKYEKEIKEDIRLKLSIINILC